jgi:hypothetical protein
MKLVSMSKIVLAATFKQRYYFLSILIATGLLSFGIHNIKPNRVEAVPNSVAETPQ